MMMYFKNSETVGPKLACGGLRAGGGRQQTAVKMLWDKNLAPHLGCISNSRGVKQGPLEPHNSFANWLLTINFDTPIQDGRPAWMRLERRFIFRSRSMKAGTAWSHPGKACFPSTPIEDVGNNSRQNSSFVHTQAATILSTRRCSRLQHGICFAGAPICARYCVPSYLWHYRSPHKQTQAHSKGA